MPDDKDYINKEQNRRIEELEKAVHKHEGVISQMGTDLIWIKTELLTLKTEIKNEFSDMKENIDKYIHRPSWAVSITITTLVGLVVSLASYIIYNMK